MAYNTTARKYNYFYSIVIRCPWLFVSILLGVGKVSLREFMIHRVNTYVVY